MFEICIIIVNRIKSWEYVSNDVNISSDWMDGYEYHYIHATMPADPRFTFLLAVRLGITFFFNK
jgi:hypothetical protein